MNEVPLLHFGGPKNEQIEPIPSHVYEYVVTRPRGAMAYASPMDAEMIRLEHELGFDRYPALEFQSFRYVRRRLGWKDFATGVTHLYDCMVIEGYPLERIEHGMNAVVALTRLRWWWGSADPG